MGRVADTRYRTALLRFLAKTELVGDCRLWTASTLRDGYGSFTDEHGKTVPAHCWFYERSTGLRLGPGQVLRHTCDTPACVYLGHLVVGTQADNIADKTAKGRQARGAACRRSSDTSVVDETGAADIRALNDEGLLTQTMLGELYGIKQSTVSDIVRGRLWVA